VDNHFGDRLVSAIHEKNAPACVGFDPLLDRLPSALLKEFGILPSPDGAENSVAATDSKACAEAILSFGRTVIEIIAKSVPVVKINIAFFERYYADGVHAYGRLVRYAQEQGLLVIGDVKRADIGHSTTQYAHAQLGRVEGSPTSEIATPDAVTVNPYFGFDGIRPFVEIARDTGRGLFVLVQTSNESAVEVQGLVLEDGTKVCERMGKIVQGWAAQSELVGKAGYSCIGAVVSPRDLASTERIRAAMPNCLFLVPGFGAQGRTTDEVAKCFKPDGTGALVTASRSVIYAYNQEQYVDAFGDDWRRCIEQGCQDFVQAIRSVTPS
jgi:orotidine-5'-phosphate decarboxylase